MGKFNEIAIEREGLAMQQHLLNRRRIRWIRAYMEGLVERRQLRRIVFKEAHDADVAVGSNHSFNFSRCEDYSSQEEICQR